MSKKSSTRFSCDICHNTFKHKNNMYRHRRNEHGVIILNEYLCDHCGYKCRIKKQLIQHIGNNHDPDRKRSTAGIRLKCPECDIHVKTYVSLDAHLSDTHELNILKERLQFGSEEEFRTWKLNVEKETHTQYSSIRGLRKRKTYTQREYMCHRSYTGVVKSTERKRAVKSLGTNKIGAACPSRMVVKISTDGKVDVEFIRIHVGHSSDVMRMRLSSDHRAAIAGKLKDGFTVQQVLDDERNSVNSENFQKVLIKRDIYNIIRDFRIDYASLHKDDAVSVQLVGTLRELEDSPVLHYNSDSEDFSLIIMTSLQKCMLLENPNTICIDVPDDLNANNYRLISIVVIDEYSNEVPVAFSFTKKTDFSTMLLFFTKVKEAVGCSIRSKVFISDDTPEIYDAWSTVMGKPDHKLLSWWYVNKNWTENLNSEISDTVKRKYVKHTLCSLATSTSDQKEFESKLTKFLNALRVDEDTRSFQDYFSSTFLSKKTSWAVCYRKHLGLNNTHLESMHKKIKHLYVEGKQCPRLNKAIKALLVLVRDTMYEHIIKLANYQQCEKMLRIRATHTKRTEIPDEDVVCVKESELWHVKSHIDKQPVYEVKRVAENCQDTNSCILGCSECDICIHSFKCSCMDNVVHLNICKHIHKIAEKNEVDVDEELGSCEIEILHVEETIELPESHPKLEDGEENVREELKTKIELLMQWSSYLSNDEQRYVNQVLDEIIQKIIFKRQ